MARKKRATKKVAKKVAKSRVPKTRNNNTMTESAYWGFVRSSLRRAFRYWKPIMEVKNAAKRKYDGPNKRQKWEYQCAHCKEWYMGKNTEVDHLTPVGSLKCKEDLVGFLERLTPESGFQLLCKDCHQVKTNKEREEGAYRK